jgi:hypothetical protein
MTTENKKPSNPRMHNPDGMYASEARNEDFVSLRDYFANSAMQSIISKGLETQSQNWNFGDIINELAKDSYRIADAMLKQREL